MFNTNSQVLCKLNCGWCPPGQRHRCRLCKNPDSDHFTRNCTFVPALNVSVTPALCVSVTPRCKVNCGLCRADHSHYCHVCRDHDSDHRSADCPSKPVVVPVSVSSSVSIMTVTPRCKVNCGLCRSGHSHYCHVCRDHDSDHRSADCPSKPVVVPVSVSSSVSVAVRFTSVTVLFYGTKGELDTLVAGRNANLSCGNRVVTFGGAIDGGETPYEAACREALEEGGIVIKDSDITNKFVWQEGPVVHHILILKRMPIVSGPDARHAWEVRTSVPLDRLYPKLVMQKVAKYIWSTSVSDLISSNIWVGSLIEVVCRKIKDLNLHV